LDILCADELNLAHKKKGYPYAFTEAKMYMALYQRWLSLKNGASPHFKEAEGKENQAPIDNNMIHKQLEQLRLDFEDPSKPIVIEGSTMMKFLIGDEVKMQFER
jgi:hypothetical protein